MYILKIGVNYQTTPLEIREKLSFSEDALAEAMISLQGYDHICENVILSTCNRTEIFAVVDHLQAGKESLIQFLCKWFDMLQEDLIEYCEFKWDEEAIRYMFQVTVGLQSLVLGETQILGQVRTAFLRAQELGTTGKLFNELFKRMITFAKRAHHETVIGKQAVSISYVAVELAKKLYGQLQDQTVAILGAGEMGELLLKNLKSSGVTDMTILNRSSETASYLAKIFQTDTAPIEQLDEVLTKVDILMTSTSASLPVLTSDRVVEIMRKRKGKPLTFIDIAVPRDIAADVVNIDGVSLYDVDDLQHVADNNMAARKDAAKIIDQHIDDELVAFEHWVQVRDAVPMIRALREKSLDIQARTLESLFRKIPDLDERERRVIQKHTKSIVNQFMKQPIQHAKAICGQTTFEEDKSVFIDVFDLENIILKNEREEG